MSTDIVKALAFCAFTAAMIFVAPPILIAVFTALLGG